MASLSIDVRIPLAGDGGYVHLKVDIGDVGALSARDREFLDGTCGEFLAAAAGMFAPGAVTVLPPAGAGLTAAVPFDPDAAVLAGVTGSRAYREAKP